MSTLSYIQPLGDEPDQHGHLVTSGERLASGQDRNGLDLRQVLNVLWRRKMIIVATVFVVTTLAILAVLQAVPLYVATSQVVVERPRQNIAGLQEAFGVQGLDFYTNETEAQVIGSRQIAERVVEELNLTQHPLFNPALRKPKSSLWTDLQLKQRLLELAPEWLRQEYRRLTAPEEAPELTPAQQRALLKEYTVDAFMAGAEVTSDDRSRVLSISYISEEADFSAQAANALAQVYINQTILTKFEENARATDWLNQQVGELRQKLEVSEKALEEHRRRVGYINLEGRANILGQQLAQLSTDLVRARADRAEAEARYRQVQKLLESPDGIESASTVLDSQLIQRLREQEAAVIR